MGAQVEIGDGPQTSLHSYQVKAVGAPLKLLRKTKKLLYNCLHCSPRGGGPCSPKLLGGGGPQTSLRTKWWRIWGHPPPTNLKQNNKIVIQTMASIVLCKVLPQPPPPPPTPPTHLPKDWEIPH